MEHIDSIPRKPDREYLRSVLPDRWVIDQFIPESSATTPLRRVTYHGAISRDLIQQEPGEVVIRLINSASRGLPANIRTPSSEPIPHYYPTRTIIYTDRTDQDTFEYTEGYIDAENPAMLVVLIDAIARYIDVGGVEVPLQCDKEHILDWYAGWEGYR